MIGINPLLLLLMVLVNLSVTSLLPLEKRWLGLFTVHSAFLVFLIEEKVLVIFGVLLITYLSGIQIEKKKIGLFIPLTFLIVVLMVPKIIGSEPHFIQYNQERNVTEGILSVQFWNIIGLSYLVFNCISYLVDIKRNYTEPEPNFIHLSSYLMFIPAFFSGPLHRKNFIFPQLDNIQLSPENFTRGLILISWGWFKSSVLSIRLIYLVNDIQSHALGGLYHLLSGLLFSLFLFISFSSFIDIMQGIAQIFNIRMKDNFHPRIYLSSSRLQFWKGWHITLNNWFRDYFFFPLIKRKNDSLWINLSLITTFIFIALWHQLSWVLLTWGFLNGCWILGERLFNARFPDFPKNRWLGTFYHLMTSSILAVLFIAADLSDWINPFFREPNPANYSFFIENRMAIIISIMTFLFMDFYHAKMKNLRLDDFLVKQRLSVRWITYSLIVVLVLFFGLPSTLDNYYNQF